MYLQLSAVSAPVDWVSRWLWSLLQTLMIIRSLICSSISVVSRCVRFFFASGVNALCLLLVFSTLSKNPRTSDRFQTASSRLRCPQLMVRHCSCSFSTFNAEAHSFYVWTRTMSVLKVISVAPNEPNDFHPAFYSFLAWLWYYSSSSLFSYTSAVHLLPRTSLLG